MRHKGFLIISAAIVALALLTGCSTSNRVARVPAGDAFSCSTDSEYLFRRLNVMGQLSEARPALDLLLLSGGGAHGAWGAGFLKGWQSRGANADDPTTVPRFDVVTGVSTGALQATHAFLGDYDELFDIYTTITRERVWSKRFLLSVPFSNSVLDSAPLSDYIDELVTPELLGRVEEEARADRLLCVGNVNLETGKFREWDLTAIASAFTRAGEGSAEGEQLLNLYRTVLLGSASIPVAFPPVEIADERGPALYVDGGTRQNVFVSLGDIVEFTRQPMPTLQAWELSRGRTVAENMPVRVYVVVNGQLGIAPATVRDRLFSIAGRSLEAVLAQSTNGAIYQIAYTLEQRPERCNVDDTESSGIVACYTYIPADRPLCSSALDFDPEEMRQLADDAFELGSRFTWFDFDPDAELAPCDKGQLTY